MDYNNTFNNRAHEYKKAMELYPNVLNNEFKTAIEMCNIKENEIILNIPAACVSLEKYFNIIPKLYLEYETNEVFCKLMNIAHCTFNKIPEENDTIDTIISIASLHHLDNTERTDLYKECQRLLKINGKLIIGDVLNNSKEAKWLNIFVDKYNSNGHKGIFWSEKDIELLNNNGFSTSFEVKTYPWIFDSESVLIDFCKKLFGLNLASVSEILDGIHTYLKPYMKENKIYIDWSLIYFKSIKNPVPVLNSQDIQEIQH